MLGAIRRAAKKHADVNERGGICRPQAMSKPPSSGASNGSGGRIRTYDQVINSHLRYHCATPEQI